MDVGTQFSQGLVFLTRGIYDFFDFNQTGCVAWFTGLFNQCSRRFRLPVTWLPFRGRSGTSTFWRLKGLLLVGAFFVWGASLARAQMIDLNGNGMSDVWEWTYNAVGVSPGADPDQDGFSNLQESIAGTDPFNSNSFPHIAITTYAGTNFTVTMPCYLGKNYSLFSVTTAGATNWVFETNQVVRVGTNVSLTVLVGPAVKFYHVAVWT